MHAPDEEHSRRRVVGDSLGQEIALDQGEGRARADQGCRVGLERPPDAVEGRLAAQGDEVRVDLDLFGVSQGCVVPQRRERTGGVARQA